MIDPNVKLNTLYINKHSGMMTYFFYKENGTLYGARKRNSWFFATWKSYSDPEISEKIIPMTDDIKKEMQIQTIKSFWDYPVEFL